MHGGWVERGVLFWAEMVEFAGVRAHSAAEATCVGEGMLGTTWFPGMRLNYAEHMLRFDDDRLAIRFESETGVKRDITARELRREVAAFAAGLKREGVNRYVPLYPPVTIISVPVHTAAWNARGTIPLGGGMSVHESVEGS